MPTAIIPANNSHASDFWGAASFPDARHSSTGTENLQSRGLFLSKCLPLPKRIEIHSLFISEPKDYSSANCSLVYTQIGAKRLLKCSHFFSSSRLGYGNPEMRGDEVGTVKRSPDLTLRQILASCSFVISQLHFGQPQEQPQHPSQSAGLGRPILTMLPKKPFFSRDHWDLVT